MRATAARSKAYKSNRAKLNKTRRRIGENKHPTWSATRRAKDNNIKVVSMAAVLMLDGVRRGYCAARTTKPTTTTSSSVIMSRPIARESENPEVVMADRVLKA
jgi:hypothetical protein